MTGAVPDSSELSYSGSFPLKRTNYRPPEPWGHDWSVLTVYHGANPVPIHDSDSPPVICVPDTRSAYLTGTAASAPQRLARAICSAPVARTRGLEQVSQCLGSVLLQVSQCLGSVPLQSAMPEAEDGMARADGGVRDQATSTTSLSVAMALSPGFSSWAELLGGKAGGGRRGIRSPSSGPQDSCSVGPTVGDTSLASLLQSTASLPQPCWRPGLEPSLLSGIQRIPSSSTTVASKGGPMENPSGPPHTPQSQQHDWLSPPLQSPKPHNCLSLPVLDLSYTGARQPGYSSPLSPQSTWQPSAAPVGQPGGVPLMLTPMLTEQRGPDWGRDVSGGSSSGPSILTQSSEGACLVRAGSWGEAGVQAASERSLLARAKSSQLFQRPRAWFISWADAMPRLGRVGGATGSMNSVDLQDGGAGSPGVPLNGARAEDPGGDPEGADGRLREQELCPRETALKLGRGSRPSPWQRLEETPLMAIN
ncbi:hypothetical protein JZ751_028285 [Albula glossodonta]|uniref:Uncharacterized protein n=1 Tax=Albula glossodonta TaxID=121402 RepID=A0A8T2MS41_9TELE|nr:hypothetical protein JZ751_028285 [Albula glossodonta]